MDGDPCMPLVSRFMDTQAVGVIFQLILGYRKDPVSR